MNDGIIHDTEMGLMWTKDANLATVRRAAAQEYADNFTLSGYIDWRAPTQVEVQDLLQGLLDWDSKSMFLELHAKKSNSSSTCWPGERSAVFLASDGSGFTYNSHPQCLGAWRIEELPANVQIWLVRSGPHSAKRFTQEEMDAIRDDAYAQGLRDAGDSRPEFSIETGTLTIPAINVQGPFGEIKVYEADLESVPATAPPLFSLTNVREITDELPPQSD